MSQFCVIFASAQIHADKQSTLDIYDFQSTRLYSSFRNKGTWIWFNSFKLKLRDEAKTIHIDFTLILSEADVAVVSILLFLSRAKVKLSTAFSNNPHVCPLVNIDKSLYWRITGFYSEQQKNFVNAFYFIDSLLRMFSKVNSSGVHINLEVKTFLSIGHIFFGLWL